MPFLEMSCVYTKQNEILVIYFDSLQNFYGEVEDL